MAAWHVIMIIMAWQCRACLHDHLDNCHAWFAVQSLRHLHDMVCLQGLVEWLCDKAANSNANFKAAAADEGLFVAMPECLQWFVDQDSDDSMCLADDAVSALNRLLADTATQGVPAGSAADPMDIAPNAADAAASAAAGGQQDRLDGKLALLLQLQPRLKRVGIALGVEVRGGVQQQVPADVVFRWPLLMALAEQLHVPMEQLFEVSPGNSCKSGC